MIQVKSMLQVGEGNGGLIEFFYAMIHPPRS